MSKVKWSNFHITINTNQAVKSSKGREAIRDFAGAIETMVHDHVWEWLKYFKGGQRYDFTGQDYHDIMGIRARVGLERADLGKNKSLHGHILMEIEHRSSVQISREGMQNVINKLMGIHCNVHVRFLEGNSDDKSYILRYISKTVPTHATSSSNRRLLRAMGFEGIELGDEIENDMPGF